MTTNATAVDQLVDWELAERTAGLLVPPGPRVSGDEVVGVVADLRSSAARAVAHVAEVSRLSTPAGPAALVVDRAGWVRLNLRGMRSLLEPVVADAAENRMSRVPGGLTAVGSRLTGAEVGSLLALLSTRVLGQYDAFARPEPRLLLVAPNVMHVEVELEVDPQDFRLWVCLHEETHRAQFGATPWLAEHLLGQVRALVAELLVDPSELVQRLTRVLRDLPGAVRGDGDGGLLDVLQSPRQREGLARLTAVMSLLEGHADVVMDRVGPDVVASVDHIRARFNQRRAGRGALDRILRRLLGLDAKMRQYADGARFVRAVEDRVGVDGFNAVWTSPDTLPLPAEIGDAAAWVRRVHG